MPVGEIYITASRESAFWAVNLCITGAGGSDMSLFSVVEHNDDRYTGSAQESICRGF